MSKLIPDKPGLQVNFCSVCEEPKVTLGNQAFGGVRFCAECLQLTLGWAQMSAEGQQKVLARMREYAARPITQAALDVASRVPMKAKKAASIGESRRRLMEANLRER